MAKDVSRRRFIALSGATVAGSTALGSLATVMASADPVVLATRNLHLTQGMADSPYSMLRLHFDPGELAGPYHVRFIRGGGGAWGSGAREEIPYSVVDWVSWDDAVNGRDDWGNRYRMLNHWPGDAAKDVAARGRKKQIAQTEEPALYAAINARDASMVTHAAKPATVMYVLDHSVAAGDRDVIGLEILDTALGPSTVSPVPSVVAGPGAISVSHLPSRYRIRYGGTPILELTGYQLKNASNTVVDISVTGQPDATLPYTVEVEGGLMTQIKITGSRNAGGGALGHQWKTNLRILPNDSMIVDHGFNFTAATNTYTGGTIDMAIYSSLVGPLTVVNSPSAARPWYTYSAAGGTYVTVLPLDMLKYGTGYDNNPFMNAVEMSHSAYLNPTGNTLACQWKFSVTGDGKVQQYFGGAEHTHWDSQHDWFHRQYLIAFGTSAAQSEQRLGETLHLAAGWIDRTYSQTTIEDIVLRSLYRNAEYHLAEWGFLYTWDYFILGAVQNDTALIDRGKTMVGHWVTNILDKHAKFALRHLGGTYAEVTWWQHYGPQVAHSMRICDSLGISYPSSWGDAIVAAADLWLELDRESSGGLLDGKGYDADGILGARYWDDVINMNVSAFEIMLAAYQIDQDPDYLAGARAMLEWFENTIDLVKAGYLPYAAEPHRAAAWYLFGRVDDTPTYSGASACRGLLGLYHHLQYVDDPAFTAYAEGFFRKLAHGMSRWAVWSHWLSDSYEHLAETPDRQWDRTSIFTTEAVLYLQQDWAFYRGLVAPMLMWSAVADLDKYPHLYTRGVGVKTLVYDVLFPDVAAHPTPSAPTDPSEAHMGFQYSDPHEGPAVYYLWASHLDGNRLINAL